LLDLAGVIPPAYVARDFAEDPSPDKRRRLVEDLLGSPEHAQHSAHLWRDFLLGPADLDRESVARFEAWLARRVTAGAGYDRIVHELLTVSPRRARGTEDVQTAELFYDVHRRTEALAATTARLFLGVNLECAQCHDHPFARWKRRQFWEYAAFFAPGGSLSLPGTGEMLRARFPGVPELDRRPGEPARVVLADWVVAADNPYFARAAVNRVWSQLFGIGLVEDSDAPRSAGHAELLDELARQFAASRFDVKFLLRGITASQPYQRSSRGGPPGQTDPRLFARAAVRGLTPEQLAASLAQAAGYRERWLPRPPRVVVAVHRQ
jgi:hypothetical protein